MPATQVDTAPAAVPPQAPPSGRGRLLLAAGVVSAVIAAEVVLAWLWLPSAQDVAELSRGRIEEQLDEEAARERTAALPAGRTVEVDLGHYSITSWQPASNTTLRVEFHLYAAVAEEQRSRFDDLFRRNEHRLRDQIIFHVRNSEIADLTDPGLSLIKRRILEKSNALLGQPVVKSVLFSDFFITEQ